LPCLALSQRRHWRQVVGAGHHLPESAVFTFRLTGWLFLLMSFFLALLRDGPAFGVALWVVLISLAAVVVAFCLTWSPRLLRRLARAMI
jgi:hypothetical protein